jgi:hypothetical protein
MSFKNQKMLRILMVSAIGTISTATAFAQNPLPHKADERVMGPGGEVMVYYKDGNDIVVRNCGSDYPNVNQRSDCKGAENRIPGSVFKEVLRSEFLVGNADKLNPMTKEEVEAYRSADMGGLEKLQVGKKELDAKLTRIQGFLNKGLGDRAKPNKEATETLLAQVRAELAKGKANGDAVKKVNALIREIVDKISDENTLHKVADGRDGDQAIFNLLQQFDASKGECGTDAILNGTKEHNPGDENAAPTGSRRATWLLNVLIPDARADGYTVEDRIKNCIALPNASKETKARVKWNLVSRSRDGKTGKFYEVWKDSQSGLLWGDRLDSNYIHYSAVRLGDDGKVVTEKACHSREGRTANAGVREKKFGLPTIEEYVQAEKNGVREALPNMENYLFWSASLYPDNAYTARGFDGNNGGLFFDGLSYDHSVRCVGR